MISGNMYLQHSTSLAVLEMYPDILLLQPWVNELTERVSKVVGGLCNGGWCTNSLAFNYCLETGKRLDLTQNYFQFGTNPAQGTKQPLPLLFVEELDLKSKGTIEMQIILRNQKAPSSWLSYRKLESSRLFLLRIR